MYMKRIIILAAAMLAAVLCLEAKNPEIIPAPAKTVIKNGTCNLGAVGGIDAAAAKIKAKLPEEGYVLTITPKKISIVAGSEKGAFYARQTLRQMQFAYGEDIPCCKIEDAPRFGWRGFMLDESRHFFGIDYVKKTLEQMAWFKLNKFHWHLTDSHGWRIQIDAYPKLTEVGAIGDYSSPTTAPRFYTKAQIREVVEYAASLNIEVIPEIDMPGHATAANRAYPEYNGGGSKRHPDFTFNVGSEETYKFLETILKEVTELFPSKYIHLGADEVFFGSADWVRDPQIRSLIEREGLDGVRGAEGYFVKRMAAFVRSLGKTPILWDDAVDVGIEGAAIMWWRNDRLDHLHSALGGGMPTILTPRYPCYFDYAQAKNHKESPKRPNFNSQEDLYAFPDRNNEMGDVNKKQPWNLTEAEKAGILGVQANLWTETVPKTRRADFLAWPRLCALAESAWSRPEVKDYEDFKARMEHTFRYLDERGVNYYDFTDPKSTPEPKFVR